MMKTANPRLAAMIVFDGVQALDVVGPLDVLAQANSHEAGAYELLVVGAQKHINATGGLQLCAEPLERLDGREIHTLLVPGGDGAALAGALQNEPLKASILRSAQSATRIASICSGAFILASLGLLECRRATTHWMGLDFLAAADPSIEVDRDAMFTQDGSVWTSAGIAAGMDLALALIRADLGNDVALAVARDLVIPVARTSGQLAYAEPRSWANQPSADLNGLLELIQEKMRDNLTVELMAETTGLSQRTLHRRCKEHFRLTPHQLLLERRLESSRIALLNSNAPLKEVAAQIGMSDEAAFSRAFKKRFGMSPSDFRSGFQTGN